MLIALGVSGGISAYKAVEVARGLQQAGHEVVAVMTESATQFVGPLTFEAITKRPVIVGQFTPGTNADIAHIQLASDIGLLLVAPATAHTLARFALGLADDFLSTLYTATTAPVLMAPAMNTQMWTHPAVQRNLQVLEARGVGIVPPGDGYLACGWTGPGRLAEPATIVEAALTYGATPRMAGLRVLVTAGPTYEDLDPVRYLGNRSSGRMGYALAEDAARRGAHVTLVTGPTTIVPPPVATIVRVRSARDMADAVFARVGDADVVVMAAAVADYTPAVVATQKVAKDTGTLSVSLERTVDILATLGAQRATRGTGPLLVGFAAETHDVEAHAREKLSRKQVDLIVANDVSREQIGFESEENAVTLVTATHRETVAQASKRRIAGAVLDRIETLLTERRDGPR